MPEIAEVEMVRRALKPLKGQKIKKVSVRDKKLALSDQTHLVENQRVTELLRRGKLLGLAMENGLVLTCHLRMTGNLVFGVKERARAVLEFDSVSLSFTDPRMFGVMSVVDYDLFADHLGPDLLDPELDKIWPPEKAQRSRRAIKAVILDQSVVAGIGNYIADETLWASKIIPTRPANELTEEDWQAILDNSRAVAERALSAGGLTIKDYKRPDGQEGNMVHHLACYGRKGEPCFECGTTLVGDKVGGRGTVYCPTCQHS